jgi:CubicO group peptidase (beta-lactamase class C family)
VEPSRPITLEDVLTHTSGLTNDVSGVKRTLHFQPGEYFRYSGTGFNYLQHVIEAVTSQTYRTWAANTVLPSAGMASSYFDNPGGGMIEAGAGLMTTPGDVSRFLVYLTDPAATDMPGDARSQMLLPHVQILEDQAWGLGDRCSDRANRKRDLALGQ